MPEVADIAVKAPPQNMSTNTTVGDHSLITAILVKLYVPYATRPNIKPVYRDLSSADGSIQGCMTITDIPNI